jgi:hypothetical protein
MPDLGVAGDEQRRHCSLARAADEVRSDHDAVPRQSIGPDAADEQEEELRERARRQHEAEVRLRTCDVEDGERERDRGHRAAEDRRRAAGEEKPELAVAERRECGHARRCSQ